MPNCENRMYMNENELLCDVTESDICSWKKVLQKVSHTFQLKTSRYGGNPSIDIFLQMDIRTLEGSKSFYLTSYSYLAKKPSEINLRYTLTSKVRFLFF